MLKYLNILAVKFFFGHLDLDPDPESPKSLHPDPGNSDCGCATLILETYCIGYFALYTVHRVGILIYRNRTVLAGVTVELPHGLGLKDFHEKQQHRIAVQYGTAQSSIPVRISRKIPGSFITEKNM